MNSNRKSMIAGNIIPAIISVIVLTFIDQISKYIIDSNLSLYSTIPLIPDVFEIHYIRNAGMAWGLFQNRQIFFYILTIIVLFFGVFIYTKCLKYNSYKDIRVLIIIISSGAIGNFIDRLRFQYVIDFLYFKLINFPVFNIADCYVTIGVFCMLYILIFKYKEEDFDKLLSR